MAVSNNTLIISLNHTGTDALPVNVTTWTTPGGDVSRETNAGCTDAKGQKTDCKANTASYGLWVSRQAYPKSPYPGVGTRIWNAQSKGQETDNRSFSTAQIMISPQQPVTIATSAMTNRDTGTDDPVPAVQSYLMSLSNDSTTHLQTENSLW